MGFLPLLYKFDNLRDIITDRVRACACVLVCACVCLRVYARTFGLVCVHGPTCACVLRPSWYANDLRAFTCTYTLVRAFARKLVRLCESACDCAELRASARGCVCAHLQASVRVRVAHVHACTHAFYVCRCATMPML